MTPAQTRRRLAHAESALAYAFCLTFPDTAKFTVCYLAIGVVSLPLGFAYAVYSLRYGESMAVLVVFLTLSALPCWLAWQAVARRLGPVGSGKGKA